MAVRDEAAILARRDAILAFEADQPYADWWLSFADEKGNRGVVVVRARGFASAVAETHLRGLNPGGEVQGFPLPPEYPVSPELLNRVFNKEELKAAFGPIVNSKGEEA